MEATVIISIIAILGTTTGALIWIIKHLFEKIYPVLDKLVVATETNTQATISSETYLRQRNGRDIEFHKEMMAKIQAIPTKVDEQTGVLAKELKRVGDLTAERIAQAKESETHQTVVEQNVEHQIIKSNN